MNQKWVEVNILQVLVIYILEILLIPYLIKLEVQPSPPDSKLEDLDAEEKNLFFWGGPHTPLLYSNDFLLEKW